MKEYKTFNQQLTILRNRGLIVPTDGKPKRFLEQENYYNVINGYKDLFLLKDTHGKPVEPETYLSNAHFNELKTLFLFDRELRFLFLKYLLIFENSFKTVISHEFSRKYPKANSYLDIANYREDDRAHSVFLHYAAQRGDADLRHVPDGLADDGALCTVDDKGAGVGHQGEVAHEDLLVLHLAGLLVQQTGGDAQGCCIGHVALFALFDAVLGLFIETEVHEAQCQIAGVVLNGADVVEDLFQALVQEPLIRVLLDLDQVRHTDDFVDVGEAHALGFAELYGLDFHHKINHSLLLYSTDIALYGSDLSTHT